jgi:predicted enzyme related to lactoylglutathione lyase
MHKFGRPKIEPFMRTQINAITIAAQDLLRLKNFYTNAFGWEIQAESMDIVIFRLKNGLLMSIYKAEDHARYLNSYMITEEVLPKTYFTVYTSSQRETDELFMELENKRVNIIKKPAMVFWGGYAGIIADPENNYWELCFNPLL